MIPLSININFSNCIVFFKVIIKKKVTYQVYLITHEKHAVEKKKISRVIFTIII